MAVTEITDTTSVPGSVIKIFTGYGSIQWTSPNNSSFAITVGQGGDVANGGNSSINTIIATGGYVCPNANGGNGGDNASYSGGSGKYKSAEGLYAGGGGAGAGGDGGNAFINAQKSNGNSGNGGNGILSSITGTPTYYGGGGGGGACNLGTPQGSYGAGGLGGGGLGGNTNSGTRDGTQGIDGLGGGGGGRAYGDASYIAGRGGHGIVIIRYDSSNPSILNYLIVGGGGGGNQMKTGSGGGGGGQVLSGSIIDGKMKVRERQSLVNGSGNLLVMEVQT